MPTAMHRTCIAEETSLSYFGGSLGPGNYLSHPLTLLLSRSLNSHFFKMLLTSKMQKDLKPICLQLGRGGNCDAKAETSKTNDAETEP